ncbi:hypothetical protein Hypma_009969 [Hypsizygus marmoreus]|uniref:Uncharacterized protein n=1 Tax=Hypsizygus marmoreus TaxID=39966 RepID=A0A369JS80_HYPMA|nr:hypothetical protein Hypma_009969 [Hypsizygus marmoreus]
MSANVGQTAPHYDDGFNAVAIFGSTVRPNHQRNTAATGKAAGGQPAPPPSRRRARARQPAETKPQQRATRRATARAPASHRQKHGHPPAHNGGPQNPRATHRSPHTALNPAHESNQAAKQTNAPQSDPRNSRKPSPGQVAASQRPQDSSTFGSMRKGGKKKEKAAVIMKIVGRFAAR